MNNIKQVKIDNVNYDITASNLIVTPNESDKTYLLAINTQPDGETETPIVAIENTLDTKLNANGWTDATEHWTGITNGWQYIDENGNESIIQPNWISLQKGTDSSTIMPDEIYVSDSLGRSSNMRGTSVGVDDGQGTHAGFYLSNGDAIVEISDGESADTTIYGLKTISISTSEGDTVLSFPSTSGTIATLEEVPTNLNNGSGVDSIEQANASAVGLNSAAFGVSEANYDGDVLKTEVRVTRGYDPKKQAKIIKPYGTEGAGSGSTGDLADEEKADETSVMYYKDGNQILSVFELDFDSTGALGQNSLAAGNNTLAAGLSSTATGWNTYAGAAFTFTEGADTIAIGENSHAEGLKNMSVGQASHTEGMRNTAEGKNSHLEGLKNHTSTNAVNSHVEGSYNNCRSSNTHIEGMWNVAIGSAAHAHIEGEENITDAINSHIEGSKNTVSGSYVDSEGKTRYSENVHIEGNNNTATTSSATQVAKNAHLEGANNTVTAENAHVEGTNNSVKGKNGHAEGSNNTIGTGAENAHAGGTNSVANGANSFVHGNRSKTWTAGGIAIGTNQFSRQNSAVSIGHSAQYVEDLKDAAGNKITVDTNDNVNSIHTAFTSLTEGNRFSAAIGPGAVSLGNSNVAHKGISLGYENYANGTNTHFGVAIGSSNIAKGQNTVAIGKGNKATVTNQQAFGVYNRTNNDAIYMVGHGTATESANAFIIDTNNNGRYRGSLYVNADISGNNGKRVATEEYVDNHVIIMSEDYIRELFA